MKTLICIAMIAFFVLPAGAARTFTDSDLEGYRQEGNSVSTERYRPKHEPAGSQSQKNAGPQKKTWCRDGKRYRDKVSRAKEDLEKAEKRMDGYREALAVSKSDLRAAMRNLKRSRENLKAAEEDYRDFEDRAYRQNIPRDWYECYYDGYDEYRGY